MAIHCAHTPQCKEISDCDEFYCDCGNNVRGDGFVPCDENGKEVEPTEEDWPVWRYVCLSCGAIVTEENK